MERADALRVLAHWSRAEALTPPLLTELDETTWGKRDGFHRLALAMICPNPVIPVWFLGKVSALHEIETYRLS